jgi:ACS family tartrate transporter-like MFS transporter
VLGVVVMFVLKEGPADSAWLAPAERAALVAALEQEPRTGVDHNLATVIRRGRTWLLAAIYFTIPVTSYGIGFWLPQMLKNASGAGEFGIGLLSAIRRRPARSQWSSSVETPIEPASGGST